MYKNSRYVRHAFLSFWSLHVLCSINFCKYIDYKSIRIYSINIVFSKYHWTLARNSKCPKGLLSLSFHPGELLRASGLLRQTDPFPPRVTYVPDTGINKKLTLCRIATIFFVFADQTNHV